MSEEPRASNQRLIECNRELNAPISQLHEIPEQQRMTFTVLENVLRSTDVATVFVDTDLNVRFFNPPARPLFNDIPGEIGRPIADLNPLAFNGAFLIDVRAVMQALAPIEREIVARSGDWYTCRISPYRTRDSRVEGVVLTFTNIADKKRLADKLEAAKRLVEADSVAKLRFLAAASHDLRQPLQTFTLLQGLLAKTVRDERAQKLITRLETTLVALTAMLDTLLDINRIEAGSIHAEIITFPINGLLDRMRDEYTYHANAKGISFHVVPCRLLVRSDPRLLEQAIRNLISNALRYTEHGKVLLGCRRHGTSLSIEVWDTGIGIPETDIEAIFAAYHRVDDAAHKRSRGLGLGLSIVQRLGQLMGHQIRVRSRPGKGSIFSVDIKCMPSMAEPQEAMYTDDRGEGSVADAPHTGAILVIEDNPELRGLLELSLKQEGYHPTVAADGLEAMDIASRGAFRPDLILADFNLPRGLDGLHVIARLRAGFNHRIPAIILTGDISADMARSVALGDCVQLVKPVKLKELTQTIRRLLPRVQSVMHLRTLAIDSATPVIFVVDDDSQVCQAIRNVLEQAGGTVKDFTSCEAFLEAYHPDGEACLVLDAYLPGMSGLELLEHLRTSGHHLPAIVITGNSDVPMAVQAMKAGAIDFIQKPFSRTELLTSVGRALELSRVSTKPSAWREPQASIVLDLTRRQRQIMDLVLAGQPSKNIAADLGLSQRTVEGHRASIMKRTGVKSLPELARLAVAGAMQAR